MPSEPVIVPPVAVINQSDSPEEIQKVGDNVQKIFDKIAPERGKKLAEAAAPPTAEPETPIETAKEPAPAPAEPPKEAPREPAADPGDRKVPSFIEKALTGELVKTESPAPAPAADEDWPEELPTFKSSDEAKTRYKNWREKYEAIKQEARALKERPPVAGVDEQTKQKLEFLENRNKEMETVLSRTTIEHHQEFQNNVLRPMHAAWNEAARIVKETGGDPQDLAKALALSGKAHFEALDNVFSDMPESAKIAANNAIGEYQRRDSVRKQWLADPKHTVEALRKGDLQRQYEDVNRQKAEMERLWDEAGRKLRDIAKVEIMQKSNDPDAKWWNEQADFIETTSKDLFLNNTDMEKVAFAMRLAPMVDPYRKLWLTAQREVDKLNQIIKDKFGSEPSLSESGGNQRNGISTPEEDLKKPFKDVFLREFHKQRERGVR